MLKFVADRRRQNRGDYREYPPEQRAALETFQTFVAAQSTHDADGARAYLADDVMLTVQMSVVGTPESAVMFTEPEGAMTQVGSSMHALPELEFAVQDWTCSHEGRIVHPLRTTR